MRRASLPNLLDGLRDLWDCARAPGAGFRRRAGQRSGMGTAVRGMLLARTLPALAGMVLGYLAFAHAYGRIQRMEGPLWDQLWTRLPDTVDPADIRAALAGLPALPGWQRVLPWMVPLAPLAVLSTWVHDAAWDHVSLWLLRGLGGARSFRETLEADAQALQVGLFGALAGLLKYLPGLSLLLGVLLLPVAVWFWILRGFALAAWHRCPPWKGVLATIIHVLLISIFVFGSLGMLAVMVLQELRPS
jgi:hypothetical protein